MWWMVAVVTAAALAATYLGWTAGRVDRLHVRAAAATRALEAHLLRRAAAVAVLAEELSATDLYAAARAALDAHPDDREAAENDLTRVLRAIPLDRAAPTADAVVGASRRVAVARQVHTDLVRDALGARRRPLVRLLRLAHRHPCPAYFDIGDPTIEPPPRRVPAPAAPVPTVVTVPAPAAPAAVPVPSAVPVASAVPAGAVASAMPAVPAAAGGQLMMPAVPVVSAATDQATGV
jgi:hypothetical protein